jgi:hypothetical protein
MGAEHGELNDCDHTLVGLSVRYRSQGETDEAFKFYFPLSEGRLLKWMVTLVYFSFPRVNRHCFFDFWSF